MFTFKVDAYSSPITNEVVEQKPRRPVVLDSKLEVAPQHAIPALGMDCSRHLARLEEHEHPAGQISIAVRVEADVGHQAIDVERDAEDVLRARLLGLRAKMRLTEPHGSD